MGWIIAGLMAVFAYHNHERWQYWANAWREEWKSQLTQRGGNR